jgi:hypothetical protein
MGKRYVGVMNEHRTVTTVLVEAAIGYALRTLGVILSVVKVCLTRSDGI